ncbi:OmpL47-type beta-barrel domain-containing protein [Amycolatopsis cihanbeyliensis]|uniref:Ig-like protein group 3 n=1 Tax=Amycolatopsis cihanbeyliensis TaxID=1128664 RepID=A0A542CS74_AMYCI|nr:copper-binding protein [Amycolatopsis cihanbeyliensis]TQI93675.1 hypothetical protein FB471_5815 [Amycolatopsis cihanbeyliensis]
MIRRLLAAFRGRPRPARAFTAAGLGTTLLALWLVPVSAAPAPDSPDAAQEQVLTWTADDSLTEYASVTTTATAGPATIVFENSEATGNTMDMVHTLTFDTSSPEYNQDVDLNILARPSDAKGGRHEAEVTLTPGKYRFYCAIPGHGQMAGVLVVTDDGGGEDTTPPEVTAEVTGDQDGEGNYVGSATVALDAQDTGSGVDSVEYEVDDTGFQPYTGPVQITEPGDHTVQYRATDMAGNTSEPGSVPFRVVEPDPGDTTPPEVTAEVTGDQDSEGNYIGSATVTLDAQDTGSGVQGIEYDLDERGFQPYTEPVTVQGNGDHTVAYRATDHSGNTSADGSVIVTIVEADPGDTTPPEVTAEVTGDQDSEGNYVGAATVTLAADDAGSGVESVQYALDDGSFGPYDEPFEVTEPGEHAVRYRATDNAGNVSDIGSVTFTVVEADPGDTTPPEVTAQVVGQQDAQWNYVDTATVSLSASDPGSGVRFLRYSLDGGSYTAYGEPFEVTGPGTHTVLYHATDQAGNRSVDGKLTFTVVASATDACPGSDVRDTVIIAGHDTTVPNVQNEAGCTINDLIAEDGQYAGHKQFVKHVRQVAKELERDGVISGQEKRRIIKAAKRSDVAA